MWLIMCKAAPHVVCLYCPSHDYVGPLIFLCCALQVPFACLFVPLMCLCFPPSYAYVATPVFQVAHTMVLPCVYVAHCVPTEVIARFPHLQWQPISWCHRVPRMPTSWCQDSQPCGALRAKVGHRVVPMPAKASNRMGHRVARQPIVMGISVQWLPTAWGRSMAR